MREDTMFEKVGHRGAPQAFPGNTMQSFRYAVEAGCTMVECDVRRAADGVPVLAHDDRVTDIHGQHWRLAEHTSVALARLDLGAGEGVPTLAELTHWAFSQCRVMADMKEEGETFEQEVVRVLSLLPAEEVVVPGAREACRDRLRRLSPSLPLSLTLSVGSLEAPGGEAAIEDLIENLDTQAVTWQYPLLTPERIARLKARHITVYAWTVDDWDTMQTLKAAGVDGIISNRPDLLVQL